MRLENRSGMSDILQANYWGVNSIKNEGTSVVFNGVGRKKNLKRTLTEIGLVVGNGAIKVGIEGTAFMEASTTGVLRPLIESHPHAVLTAVVAVSGVWAGVSSLKFLKEEKVNNVSPNWLANRVYNRFPGPSKARDLITAILPRFATVDLARIPIVWTSAELLSAMVVAKTMGVLVGMGELGVLEIYKKIGGKKKEAKMVGEKRVENEGVLFEGTKTPNKRSAFKTRMLV